MVDEYIRKAEASDWLKQYGQDVLHGKYKFSLMYIWKNIMDLPSADVVQVVRCRNCKHHTYDEIFSSFWCEYPGRVRDTTPDGFCEKGEE